MQRSGMALARWTLVALMLAGGALAERPAAGEVVRLSPYAVRSLRLAHRVAGLGAPFDELLAELLLPEPGISMLESRLAIRDFVLDPGGDPDKDLPPYMVQTLSFVLLASGLKQEFALSLQRTLDELEREGGLVGRASTPVPDAAGRRRLEQLRQRARAIFRR